MSIRGIDGVSLKIDPRLLGAGTTVVVSRMVCKAGDEQRSTAQTPRWGSPPPAPPGAFARARKTTLPSLLIEGWLKLKKFFPTPAGPGGEMELLTTVTHLPVALLIAPEQALATGGGAAASLPPHAANKNTLLDAIAR